MLFLNENLNDMNFSKTMYLIFLFSLHLIPVTLPPRGVLLHPFALLTMHSFSLVSMSTFRDKAF